MRLSIGFFGNGVLEMIHKTAVGYLIRGNSKERPTVDLFIDSRMSTEEFFVFGKLNTEGSKWATTLTLPLYN